MFRPLLLGVAALSLLACQGSIEADDAAEVETTALEAGQELPEGAVLATDFTLTDTTGAEHTLSDYLADGKTVVLEWFNPDCPVSKRYHSPERQMAATFDAVKTDDLVWLAINSGAPGKQGHGLERNARAIDEWQIPYPVLLDESGEVGKAYEARTTPHMFIVSPNRVLLYDGAIDDSSSTKKGVNFVQAALTARRAGLPIEFAKTQPFGCSVKY